MEVSGVSQRQGRQRRYPRELKERAVRMVFEVRAESGDRHGAVRRVADKLGVGVESVRNWVNQAEVDRGDRAGTTTADGERIRKLEQENRELRRANEILRRASAFFAAELDRPQK